MLLIQTLFSVLASVIVVFAQPVFMDLKPRQPEGGGGESYSLGVKYEAPVYNQGSTLNPTIGHPFGQPKGMKPAVCIPRSLGLHSSSWPKSSFR